MYEGSLLSEEQRQVISTALKGLSTMQYRAQALAA